MQARWILEHSNWLAPMWWDTVVFDRTIAVQWLIATSYSIFGPSVFSAHIPSIICAVISLILTGSITKILLGKSHYWISTLILCTTYIWVDYAHMSTQDMPLLSLELLGIWSLLKSNNKSSRYFFIVGLSIGISFFLKSVMVLIPLFSILPYVFLYRRNIFYSLAFWSSIFISLLPFIFWILLSINKYSFTEVSLLWNKIYYLSSNTEFTKSSLYYFWNIPLTTFPWSIFSLIGVSTFLRNFKSESAFILFIYPIIFILLLTCFRTKTPYYPLQITPFIAINAYLGLFKIIEGSKPIKTYFKRLISLTGIFIIIYSNILLINKIYFGFTGFGPFNFLTLYLILTLFGFCLSLTFFTLNNNQFIICLLLAPLISFSIASQSNLFTDRDPLLRNALENENLITLSNNNQVDFLIEDYQLENKTFSKLIKLALNQRKLGSRLPNLESIKKDHYAWIPISLKPKLDLYGLRKVSLSSEFDPWMLVHLE
ncbi:MULTISPECIES: ArnT family glycosyltransferase [unclassified Prochlorococcus]|uniref:ArnT family glycosyltransferase n=1 Tax=unclassified Prochlorococcus TaxID=2627481 RepID=UPI000B173183|nr:MULTISPECIES: glycosyltransferase family 39 protein [unclassified Prochlorococcus]